MRTVDRSVEAPVWLGVGITMMLFGYGFGDAAVTGGLCAIASNFLLVGWNAHVLHLRRRAQAIENFNRIWSR